VPVHADPSFNQERMMPTPNTLIFVDLASDDPVAVGG